MSDILGTVGKNKTPIQMHIDNFLRVMLVEVRFVVLDIDGKEEEDDDTDDDDDTGIVFAQSGSYRYNMNALERR